MRLQWHGVQGKQVLITGGTSGIGLAAAAALAALGAKLAIVARSEGRARGAVAHIKAVAGRRTKVDVLFADLSSQVSVRRLADQVLSHYGRLDVLVNNAGAMYGTRQLSDDGIELTWAVNHLAPFLLTTLLLARLKKSAPARIITTSSDAHHFRGHIRFDDLNAERFYWGFGRYGETKLANILFTIELARRLQGTGVTANCFHPGIVATGFNQNNGWLQSAIMGLVRPFSRTPEKGAGTLVWLANSPDVADQNGIYFVDCQATVPSFAAQDMDAARRLWNVSEEQVHATRAAGPLICRTSRAPYRNHRDRDRVCARHRWTRT
jgi:NAD(P)-dependent dehydrogenase (short-subunit alcohol dehydrogenase family)